jgi:hypothetical protein
MSLETLVEQRLGAVFMPHGFGTFALESGTRDVGGAPTRTSRT